MGNAAAHTYGDRTSLVRGLGASIKDFMRPTRAQIGQAWDIHDKSHRGYLGKEDVLRVLEDVIEAQINAAREESSKVKHDMAKQQAKMEKDCRLQRAEVMATMQSNQALTKDALDLSVALVMGSGTGPVMAGMMAGYMDIPVTCLTKMKEDKELLEARTGLLFRLCATADGCVSQEDFANNYLEFFDNAPRVLGDGNGGAVSSTAGSATASGECVLQ